MVLFENNPLKENKIVPVITILIFFSGSISTVNFKLSVSNLTFVPSQLKCDSNVFFLTDQATGSLRIG